MTHLIEKDLINSLSKPAPADVQLLRERSFETIVPQLLNIDTEKFRNINLRRHLRLAQKPVYRCHRKYCHTCLMLNYDDDFKMCKNSRNWICHFCMGVCACTRCLRQDTITQIKAYYISMGGTLDVL